MWLASSEKGLCRLWLAENEETWRGVLEQSGYQEAEPDGGGMPEFTQQLDEYFCGKRGGFSFPVDLSVGTPFQQRVWEAARRIPHGHTATYGELASTIGAPKAARAVGSALGANPVLIVVPCHRVLRSDGALGGFAAGLNVKAALLRLEGRDRPD